MKIRTIFITLYAVLLSAPLLAQNQNIKFSGFGTLGVIYSDSDLYGYRKDVGSQDGAFSGSLDFKTDSLLGLQVDAAISDDIDFIGQTILKEVTKPSFDRFLTLAFIRYQASPQWTFRIGRTAPDLFLLTEFRDVDFAYTWATPPNEVYGIIPYRSIDGADVTYTHRLNNGTLKTKLFTGMADAEISSKSVTETIKIKDVLGLSLSYDKFNWALNANFSQVTFANEANSNKAIATQVALMPEFIWPNSIATSEELLIKGAKSNYASVSGRYDWDNWRFTAEFSRIDAKVKLIPTISSMYAGLTYQHDEHSFFMLYSSTSSNAFDISDDNVNIALIPELYMAFTDAVNFYASNQDTSSIGWRWNLSNNIASTLQFNVTNINEHGGTLWVKKAQDSSAETVHTTMFNVSFVF
ncbi:porin [Psychrobium sp. 1_MG-2023]|uniref:porin n=1 Tax=Psychrobium sp. 1_MG-2023 TaxID=3062624 RepID=UPI000C342D81|nr:porin [Psychrobium sp. 1_MG-2023]MDP2560673.1 porin [Psychrobium sp. 1_MG-2023]PKF56569.1 hypothetical protein CW748_08775 [Alteromonadales bacterium alter-6D02]